MKNKLIHKKESCRKKGGESGGPEDRLRGERGTKKRIVQSTGPAMKCQGGMKEGERKTKSTMSSRRPKKKNHVERKCEREEDLWLGSVACLEIKLVTHRGKGGTKICQR